LSSFDIETITLLTLLFQTGYLTIKHIRQRGNSIIYGLSYPNLEVRMSLNNKLAEIGSNEEFKNRSYNKLDRMLSQNKFDEFIEVLTGVFAGIPYNWYVKNHIENYEGFYCSIVYSYLIGIGYTLVAEDVTNFGRIDLTMQTDDKVIIMEFKLSTLGDANSAIQQITNKGYATKYKPCNKPIYVIGVSFDPVKRNVSDFKWLQI